MKNYKLKTILLILSIILLSGLELLKYKLFNVDFNIVYFIIKTLLFTSILIINNIKINKHRFINNFINIIILIIFLLTILFNSFNPIGMFLLFSILILFTITFMTITNHKFEISLVISTSILILFFILIGIFNLLKISYIFLIIIIISSIIYLIKNKNKTINSIKNINKKTFIIFSILFLVAILSGVGRYVHKWDEYSYWAYAAKVTINTSSIKDLVSYTGTMYNYPPVSSIWHYIVHLFIGYSEPNLYIGLTLLDFIFLMPLFMKIEKKNIIGTILLMIIGVTFPYLFNGSISYGLLYVDLLLGLMCACTLILEDYINKNKKSNLVLYILLTIITLLKPNGFVYSCCLLLLFLLKNICSEASITFKLILNKIKKYILPVVYIIVIYIGWTLLSKIITNENLYYNFSLMPDSLKPDIIPKLNITFIINYIDSLIKSFDESILYSFINIPLFPFLIIIFGSVYIIQNKEKNYGVIRSILPYLAMYIIFFILTALSLFVMFSYYEATKLASFSRYLAPINLALVIYILFKINNILEDKKLIIIYLTIISFIGFTNTTFFITDIKNRAETHQISKIREETFSIINNNTEEHSKVFVINQEDTETIMPLWYARYYCYPRVINSSSSAITWKIKTPSNEWDLQDWGLTLKTLEEHLIEENFDYVYLYSKTDELLEELNKIIEDGYDIEKYKLFKINKQNNQLKLIPII